ncbi:DUF4190 domain-containing protein [Microbacterium sp. cx-55]|uniref:DUF4190 domain-containing protein n=1 Tax=Microbacterium sp. cx-55 TaxID=2875948 RepID=UPI001CC098A5|nr:DUF4190 domain-containing protein [Microbacterium sp. cx-55]MBZ4487270.1 DUF4190 domain-containing protein [Microbacterium sp. cx-55]UGB35293.1 DUF4190 domain-containing protein [Microbacterium sp. cx-55]
MNRTIGPNGTYAAATDYPGRTMGITAFVLSFFLQVIALILGIIAIVQSRRAGVSNNLAIAAVVISAVLIATGVIVWIAVVASRLT